MSGWRTSLKNYGAHYWYNELKLSCYEDINGHFFCTGEAVLNSVVAIKFECQAVDKNKAFDLISYNILHFLAKTQPYKQHFVLNISHPNFSILNGANIFDDYKE